MAFDLYKKRTVGDATLYTRPFQTVSYGPLGGNNSMIISEEDVTVLSDNSVVKVPSTQINVEITDPNAAFDLIDPTSGAVIGSKTFAQLKVEMYSLYLHLAAQRDAAE